MDNTRSFLLSEGFLPNAIFLELRGSSIYEAWNFGLDKIFSHGGEVDWIAFIGMDDLPCDLSIFDRVFLEKESKDKFISFTNVGKEKKVFNRKNLLWGQKFNHAGALHKKSLFANNRRFSTSYKIVGDYDFMLRINLEKCGKIMNYLPYFIGPGGYL